MPLDGITLCSVVQELSATLAGGRVDKIQQPESDEIIMAIRSRGKNHRLLLTANANSPRIHLSGIAKTSPPQAPMFCMLLRKHLGGGRVLHITQPGFERIVEMAIESPNEMGDLSVKRLIIEIMGKHSNIMLVDASGTIMDSVRHVSRELSSVREVLPGRAYARPPSQGKVPPVPVDGDYFLSLITGGKKVQQIIYQSYNGISPVMGSEICLRADVPPDAFPETVSEADKAKLLASFTGLYRDVTDGIFDCRIYNRDEGKREFSAIRLTLYLIPGQSESFASPSEMLETYYRRQDIYYRLAQKTTDLRKLVSNHLERCKRKAQLHNETLLEIEGREELRRFGELLTAYIYSVPAGADRVRVQDFYDNSEIDILLDPTLSPSENAQRYFKSYNKAKRTFLALKDQMKANAEDLSYLDSVLAALVTVTTEEDIAEIRLELADQGFLKKRPQQGKNKGKVKKSKPLHYRSSDGFDIYVGKNNTQNDELTLRFAQPSDIWLHTKVIAGSHVIIQGGGGDIPEQTILEGAKLAAYHSKGRQSSQVPVDYTRRRHVRKPKGAKPGFVIYDSYKTLYVTPDENKLPDIAMP